MPKISLFALVFALIACSAPPPVPVTLTVPPTNIPTSIPTLTETATPIPTETPAPATIDPYLRVDLGQGLWESSADMTIDLGNGPIEFKFASEEAKMEVKRACDIAMWFSKQAGEMGGKSGSVDVTGTLVPFEEFMEQVKANNGIMEDMYELGQHPSGYHSAQAKKIGTVNLSKCTISLNGLSGSIENSPISGGSRLPWMWFKFGVSNDGTTQITLAPWHRAMDGGPYLSKDLSKEENAANMSKIVAIWVENMERLAKQETINILLPMGDMKKGDPRRVDLSYINITKYDLQEFFESHPDASKKWIKLIE